MSAILPVSDVREAATRAWATKSPSYLSIIARRVRHAPRGEDTLQTRMILEADQRAI